MVRDAGSSGEVACRPFPEGAGRSQPVVELGVGSGRGVALVASLPIPMTRSENLLMSTIRPVTLDDVVGLERYDAIRDDLRRRVIALKRKRRVPVGDEVTFVFENHATVFFQIQEMLRAERITDLDAVRDELAVYNELLPHPGELSATMLIEITRAEDAVRRLHELLGIDACVRLEIGAEHAVAATFEEGHSKEDKLSAVQYVRFSLSEPQREAFGRASVAARLVIDHRNYQAATTIEGDVRASLIEDLPAGE